VDGGEEIRGEFTHCGGCGGILLFIAVAVVDGCSLPVSS